MMHKRWFTHEAKPCHHNLNKFISQSNNRISRQETNSPTPCLKHPHASLYNRSCSAKEHCFGSRTKFPRMNGTVGTTWTTESTLSVNSVLVVRNLYASNKRDFSFACNLILPSLYLLFLQQDFSTSWDLRGVEGTAMYEWGESLPLLLCQVIE